jgi:regulatory protein
MAVRQDRERKARPPLDEQALEGAALRYAGRYATTRAKLTSYLARKVRERGWAGAGDAPIADTVRRMAALGYVDDGAYAAAKSAALARKGYGERRVVEALRGAGVAEEDVQGVQAEARIGAWAAALRFAERRKLGPFAAEEADREGREKAIAAMLRAGHPLALARRLADAHPGEIPEPDEP